MKGSGWRHIVRNHQYIDGVDITKNFWSRVFGLKPGWRVKR